MRIKFKFACKIHSQHFSEMQCHYVVLGVERTATADELKKAYRSKALEFHPDKNPDRKEEATELFTHVQAAYEVLSDPHERTWYDSHRDAILRAGNSTSASSQMETTPTCDLMRYFSPSCYTSITDPSPKGFYAIYNALFIKLSQEESESIQTDPESIMEHMYDDETISHTSSTLFGDATTLYEPYLHSFYTRFMQFQTVKSFRWMDVYKMNDIPDRRVRRLAKKHNHKMRSTARKEFVDAVRRIAAYLYKRDPRVAAYLAEKERIKNETHQKIDEQKRAQRAHQRALAEAYKEAEWTKHDPIDVIQEDDCDLYLDEFVCISCDKTFRSAMQLANHEKSKKHIEATARLRAELLADGFDTISELDPDDSIVDEKEVAIDDVHDQKYVESDVESCSSSHPSILPDNKHVEKLVMDMNSVCIDSELAASPTLSSPVLDVIVSDDNDNDVWNTKKSSKSAKGKRKPREKGKAHSSTNLNTRVPVLNKTATQAEMTAEKQKHVCKTDKALKESEWVCNGCTRAFSTRNKMFEHIKISGHALAVAIDSLKDSKSKTRQKRG
ncbi:hypothetical protein RTP6_007491 [Batrachochytrium dendrobatidis]